MSPNLMPLFNLQHFDIRPPIEQRLEKHFQSISEALHTRGEDDGNSWLFSRVSISLESHNEATEGLLFGILTDIPRAASLFNSLNYVNRDGFSHIMTIATNLTTNHWPRLHQSSQEQMIWLVRELVQLSVGQVEDLVMALLRHVGSGDIQPRNVTFLHRMLDVLELNRSWLSSRPTLVGFVVYTLLSLSFDHVRSQFSAMYQRELELAVSLCRHHIDFCIPLGRELVRLLSALRHDPLIASLWHDLETQPHVLGHSLAGGIAQLVKLHIPPVFLKSRITPDQETQLMFMMTQIHLGQHLLYQQWFQQHFLAVTENDRLIVHLIRFIVCAYHPQNAVLQSDVVPRWMMIGWLLRCIRTTEAAQEAKLALIYDLLFFSSKDSIMLVEPCVLLIKNSATRYSDLSSTLLSSLISISHTFYPPLTADIRASIALVLSESERLGVIPNVSCVTSPPNVDPDISAQFIQTFPLRTEPTVSPPASPVTSDPADYLGPAISPLLKELTDSINSDFHDLTATSTFVSRVAEAHASSGSANSLFTHDLAMHLSTLLTNEIQDLTIKSLLAYRSQPQWTREGWVGIPPLLFSLLRRLVGSRSSIDLVLLAAIRGAAPCLGPHVLAYIASFESLPKGDADEDGEIGIDEAEVTFHLFHIYASNVPLLSPSDVFLKDMTACSEMDLSLFFSLLPIVCRGLVDYSIGNPQLVNLVASVIEPSRLLQLVCDLAIGKFEMIGSGSINSLVASSLSWESFEQFALWQMISAEWTGHSDRLGTFVPDMLMLLSPQEHPEPLAGLFLLLKDTPPDLEILRRMLSLPSTWDPWLASLFAVWSDVSFGKKLAAELAYLLEELAESEARELALAHLQYLKSVNKGRAQQLNVMQVFEFGPFVQAQAKCGVIH